jgi:putative sigma-54 modulation protein
MIEPLEFNVQIFCKGIELTNPIRDYVMEKIHKIERLTDNIIQVIVRIEKQRLDHSVTLDLKFSSFKIFVHGKTVDMYSAIDRAFEKLEHKMRKWKDRIQDHQAKKTAAIDMKVHVLKAPADEVQDYNVAIKEQRQEELEKIYFPPEVVKTKTRPLKVLSLEEAIMKMELSGDHFLLFKAEEDQMLKVIYRRRDGSYGVIIPT